ncbi:FecR family protein [Spirosoma spitsbergense]|uniref:FecR family protein n=1 Tax=Spirosoma spitsbergense TaxID=431554 RepID=UPI0012FB182F|nr:FecR domain-containing protein [Spirosoma spitsbergense]
MVTKDLILKSFDGRTTPLQRALLVDWLEEPANVEQYYEWLEEWERDNPQFLPDVVPAFERSLQQTRLIIEPDKETGFRPAWGRWLLAASVVLALLMGSAWLLREPLLNVRYHTAFGELRTLTLPDGSRVTLNANTQLRLSRWQFGRQTREVWLTGEAEFSVRHLLSNQPFLVHTPDGLTVRVLGTEFVVYSRARGSKVALTKGSVQLQADQPGLTRPLIIKPGDVVTLSSKGRFTLRHQQTASTYTAWKDHQFIFDNTSLTEVAYQITEQFGVTVDVPDTALAQSKIGGTFRAQSAPELLDVIAQMLNVHVYKTGRQHYRLTVNP